MEEKRRFTRIVFSTPAELKVGNEVYGTSLIDVSLKGALISTVASLSSEVKGKSCSLHFDLQGSEVEIDMQGTIVHFEPDSIGIKCDKIDIESVSHLRRLIELNVGSSDLLERELETLSVPNNASDN